MSSSSTGRRRFSRAGSNISFRSLRSRSPQHRNVAQQTSHTSHRSARRSASPSARQRSSSPVRYRSPLPVRSPSPSPTRTAHRKRFGLNVPTNQTKVAGKFDFEDRYPEDPIYEEMSSNARVWRAFLDECEVFDNDMVTEARDGLDLLLVFAGLFSAVLTTFVAQTSQALSANFSAISASVLIEMVALQRAQAAGISVETIPASDLTTGPSGFDVWANALWFTSLTLSLGTALMAVLVKQWLHQYMSMISGTARDRSLIRFHRFEGLQKWHVLIIIGTLPIVLHVALGLFLVGLVVFLIPLNIYLASIVGSIALIIYTVYAGSNILPIIYIQCPYRTPFSDILNVLLRPLSTLSSLIAARIRKVFPAIFGDVADRATGTDHVFRTLKDAERIAATNDDVAEDIASRALRWLHQVTSNPPTKRIILESLGCLSDGIGGSSEELRVDLEQTLAEVTPVTWDFTRRYWYRLIPSGLERRVERMLRAVRDPGTHAHSTPWRLDLVASDQSFQLLNSILAHAPNISVEMESTPWSCSALLTHFIDQQFLPTPFQFPPQLWGLLIRSVYTDGVPCLPACEDNMFLGDLSYHAVSNFDGVKQSATPPPFSGAVAITHRTVPLFRFVVDILVKQLGAKHATDSFDFEPFQKLFTIHDYAVSSLPLVGRNLGFDRSVKIWFIVLGNAWATISRLVGLSDYDRRILCSRAQDVIIQMPLDEEWWDSRDDEVRCIAYDDVLITYLHHEMVNCNNCRPEFIEKLLSDLCSSLARDRPRFSASLSSVLESLHWDLHMPIYFPLICASPFLSTQTASSFKNCCDFLYPVMSTFVDVGDKDVHILRKILDDPHRLYTICRIFAMGGNSDDWKEQRRAPLLDLARMDPTHAVWANRAHYMLMDVREWPYLRLIDRELDDEVLVEIVNERLKDGLRILNEFFASLDDNGIRHSRDTDTSQSASESPSLQIDSHWKHIRQLVLGTRAFLKLRLPSTARGSLLDEANNMELGIQPIGEKIYDSPLSVSDDEDLASDGSISSYIYVTPRSSPLPSHSRSSLDHVAGTRDLPPSPI